ncbi:lipase family alpha/beta hydrolase [Pedococcus bigeumensis]|nr:alpha/beta fold hydrolase [Pedococcus bigeumensis]
MVLVHGLFSSASTWDHLVGLFEEDPLVADIDIRTFEYPSPYLQFNRLRAIPNIDVLADSLATYLENLKRDGAGPLVLIGHSQGGLVIQRFLHRTLSRGHSHELEDVRGIVLLACPNGGSDLLVGLRRVLFGRRHAQLAGLAPLTEAVAEAHQTVVERVIFARENTGSARKIPLKAFAGQQDAVVTIASARGAFPDVGVLPGDHFSILKPSDRSDLRYCAVQREILAALHVDDEGNRRITARGHGHEGLEVPAPQEIEIIAEILDTQFAPTDSTTPGSLAARFQAQQEQAQATEDSAIAELLSAPSSVGLHRVLVNMTKERVISRQGIRVHLVDQRAPIYARLVPRDVSVEILIERRDGSLIAQEEWRRSEDYFHFMEVLAALLRTNSLMSPSFDATFWLKELVTALFRLRTERRRFALIESLDDALEYCSPQWAIYEWGIGGWYEHRLDPYIITASRLGETDWGSHMEEKTWVDARSFQYALETSRLLRLAGRLDGTDPSTGP